MICVQQLQYKQGSFSLHFDKAEISKGLTLIVGANGAGKTTLMELLSTATLPHAGRIKYHGYTLRERLPLIRSQIGYAPSDIQLYEDMTVYKMLVYLAELKGMEDKSIVDQFISEFRLGSYAKIKIKRLSEGIRRRIVIVQALMATPTYLFLDEPMNGMDAQERKFMISYLSLYAKNRCVVVSAHEITEWEAAADRILWIEHGRMQFLGPLLEWTNHLPSKVWGGTLSHLDFLKLPEQDVMKSRMVSSSEIDVRIIADRNPHQELLAVPATLEDAYFIRKRHLERLYHVPDPL